MIILSRRFITVIEMLLVIAILVLITGIVGVNIKKLMTEQRFNSEVSLVVDELRLAQDLMLIMNTDAHVKFDTAGAQGIRYWIEVEKKPSDDWMREITKPRRLLTAIRKIEFQDLISGSKTDSTLDFKFLSGGSVMSTGIIYLATADRTLERYICLPGNPNPIVSSSTKCDLKSQIDFAERLTFAIQRELTEKDLANPKPKK